MDGRRLLPGAGAALLLQLLLPLLLLSSLAAAVADMTTVDVSSGVRTPCSLAGRLRNEVRPASRSARSCCARCRSLCALRSLFFPVRPL